MEKLLSNFKSITKNANEEIYTEIVDDKEKRLLFIGNQNRSN